MQRDPLVDVEWCSVVLVVRTGGLAEHAIAQVLLDPTAARM